MNNYEVLTLAEVVQQWCHPHIVLQIMNWEPQCSASEVESLGRVHLTNRGCRRNEAVPTPASNPYIQLRTAWEDLELDLRRRIEQRLIYLRGVRIAPERHTEAEIIPGVWAAEFQFDFIKGMITVGELRFTAVACSLDPWAPEHAQAAAKPQLTAAPPIAETLAQLRPEDFPTLSDELVLALLEEHARRVVVSDSDLIAPGKVSLLPIILRKMQSRAATGEMFLSLTAEAEWLARWIKDKVELHQAPKAATISRALSTDYNLLKPRSTPAIQKTKI